MAVLGYKNDATIPPANEGDVLKFITLFRNAGTATNYVGMIARACRLRSLSLDWRGPALKMALQGLKKVENYGHAGLLKQPTLLDQVTVMRLVALCHKLQEFQEAAPLFMLAWDFLLRVQSEAVDLQAGAVHELYDLPPGRHSAVVI